MRQVVVMLEEESARIVVEALADKLSIDTARLITIPHQGKSELERSVRNKLLRWASPEPPRFVILRDNDRSDCKKTKSQVLNLIPDCARARTRVRLVIQELEAWYFGDLAAVEAAGLLDQGEAERLAGKAKFRDPDEIANPKIELKRLVKNFPGQIDMARRVAAHMGIINSSRSFAHFVSALRWAAE